MLPSSPVDSNMTNPFNESGFIRPNEGLHNISLHRDIVPGAIADARCKCKSISCCLMSMLLTNDREGTLLQALLCTVGRRGS